MLLDLLKAVQEEVTRLLMAVVKFAHHVAEQESTSGSESDISRARIRSTRWTLVGSNGRMTTRLFVGFRTMPVRRIFGRTRRSRWPLGDGIHMISSHLHLTESRERAFQQLHFAKGQQEGKGRFGPLVQVDAVFLETVVAPSGLGVIEVEPQVIGAQEPLEGEPGFLEPDRVFGGVVGLDAGGDAWPGLRWAAGRTGPVPGRAGRSRSNRSGGSSRSATFAVRGARKVIAGPATSAR